MLHGLSARGDEGPGRPPMTAKQFTKSSTPVGVALFALALATACGGGNDSAAAREPAPPPVATGTTDRPPGAGKTNPTALRRYVDRVEAQVRAYDAVRVAANSALDGVNRVEPDRSWNHAARQLGSVRARYARLATELARIEPPPPLVDAHDGLVESLSLFARIARILAADLDNYDGEAVAGWTAEITPLANRARGLRDTWQAEVLAALERGRVQPPEWLEALGRADLKA